MQDAIDAWELIRDDLDLARTRASVKARMFGLAAPATRLGRFEILGTAGEGAMGRVYVAHDPELDRKVALKVIRSFGPQRDLSERRRARLLREAQAIARVQHPNVITVHEVGRLGDDVFIVMEYIEGTSLTQWLSAQPREWPDVLHTFVQAGKGLAAAHDQQVVHRDFKPDNVLVSEEGRALVVDFGLARQPALSTSSSTEGEPLSSGPANLTRTGAVAGTPAYMAPEQRAGIAADARSDQFSYCVALFEAIHGVRPFAAASWEEVIAKVKAGTPSRVRRVPDWLHAAVCRGLRYDPDERFATMDALLRVLTKRRVSRRATAVVGLGAIGLLAAGVGASQWLLDDTPRCDKPPAKVATAWSPSRAAALTSALAASNVNYAPRLAERVVDALDDYTAQWAGMHRETCEATHVRNEQSASLFDRRMFCLDQKLAELRRTADILIDADEKTILRAADIAGSLSPVATCADVEQLLARAPLPADPQTREAIAAVQDRVAQARAQIAAAQYGEALETLDAADPTDVAAQYGPLRAQLLLARGLAKVHRQERDAERVLLDAVSAAEGSRDDVLAADVWRSLAATTRGDANAARRAASHLERFEAAVARLGNPPRDVALLTRVRGVQAWRAGRFDDTIAFGRAALATGELPPRSAASARTDVASALFRKGDYAGAAAEFERLAGVFAELHGPAHPFTARALANRGAALVGLGDNVAAIAVLEHVLELRRAAFGPDHHMVANTLDTLAGARYQAGQFEAADRLYREALRINEAQLGPDDPLLAGNLGNLARTGSELGRHDEAIAHARRAVEVFEAAKGEEHAQLGSHLSALGYALTKAGHLEDAAVAHRRSLQVRTDTLGEDNVETAYSRRSLADALHRLGRADEALKLARSAAATLEATVGPKHPQLASALLSVGRIELHDGTRAAARTALERALAIYAEASAPPTEVDEARRLLEQAAPAP